MAVANPSVTQVASALSGAAPTLDPDEQRLALALYRALIAGRPVAPGDLASTAGLEPHQVEEALSRWPGVYRDRRGRIVGFWGLAISGMPHRMLTDAGEITTWCALDPLLIAPLVTDEARVESNDPITGEPISLTVTPEGTRDVDPATTMLSMVRPEGPFSHDIVESFCNYVHFFASAESGRQWVAQHPGTFLLSLDDAFAVATRAWPSLLQEAILAER